MSLSEVEEKLRDQPFLFRFFQAVYLLQRMYPERERVGRFVRPDMEAIRFSAAASMAFPASEIQEIEWTDGEAPRVSVNFMGLTGPSGLLPTAYTELVMERLRARDRSLVAFFDIFNHRMIALFYAAWEKHRFLLRYENDAGFEGFSRYLGAFCGTSAEGLLHRQPIKDEALLFYSGFLAMHSRPATALQNMLADYFDVPVEIEEFVGAWYKLDASSQCRFSGNGSYTECLGLGVVVGDEIWSQSRVRIRLGPLSREQYQQFLPVGAAYPQLCALTKFFSGNEVDFEVQLIMKRDNVPACQLGDGGWTIQLGWCAWLKSTEEFDRDPGETVFLLN